MPEHTKAGPKTRVPKHLHQPVQHRARPAVQHHPQAAVLPGEPEELQECAEGAVQVCAEATVPEGPKRSM